MKLYQAIICAMVFATGVLTAEIQVKDGDKLAFLGDSITAQGASNKAGYVNLVASAIKDCGLKVEIVPAGISGHKSNQMRDRLEKDVISKNPQIMFLSCGVNDVWHGRNGVPLEDYKVNITAIIDKAQAAGIKVYVLTSTMITEIPERAENKKLAAYNDFLRAIAKEKNCVLVDLNEAMQGEIAALKARYPKVVGLFLTVDGVHMNAFGNIMMAKGILKALGLTEAQLLACEKNWDSIGFAHGTLSMTVAEFKLLAAKAYQAGMNYSAYVNELVRKEISK